jgi:hypothetical protein
MPAERAPMRKVREVLRLKHALGASEREIAVSVGVSRSTIGEYLRRAAVIGIPGRLRSERAAAFARNPRPTSSEYASSRELGTASEANRRASDREAGVKEGRSWWQTSTWRNSSIGSTTTSR